MSPPKTPPSQKSGNIFDRFIRQMFERITIFTDFLYHYASPNLLAAIDLTQVTPFPTHSFDRNTKERIADLIFLCGLKNQSGQIGVIIVFEHAGGSIHFLPKRLLEYLIGAWNIIAGDERKKILLPSPYFIVVRTGKKPKRKHKIKYQKTSNMCVKVEGLTMVNQLDFDYDVVYLPDIELDNLLGSPLLKTTLGVAKVLTEGHPEYFSDALLPLKNYLDYDEKRRVVNLALELFANFLRARHEKPNINDLDRVLSPIFNEQEKQNMITTIFEDKFLEGKIEGKMEGKIEGIAMGKAEAILDILKMRFKKSVPRSINNKVLSIRDSIVLASLTESAITCQSLKDFSEDL
ncbi:MAG: Rpn family recombination-promoting nuclease/putative transposase [Planctomycetaceae bacterium]|jgi:hypothetical protein|nr:Rpn family recombination-promoting nuclease/putative transposase [Planctomycetaceae bacterium]